MTREAALKLARTAAEIGTAFGWWVNKTNSEYEWHKRWEDSQDRCTAIVDAAMCIEDLVEGDANVWNTHDWILTCERTAEYLGQLFLTDMPLNATIMLRDCLVRH